MCYSIYISTTLDDDLSLGNSELVNFERVLSVDPITSLLEYEYKWYVASKSGCSCTFRHLTSTELGFGAPVDWYEEQDDEIAATLVFIKIVRKVIDQGGNMDCINIWYGADIGDIMEETVNLREIENEQFRFFENYRFLFI
jgi:hypothetical protein